jgi:regulator of cell morphogenesis and NO signaling
MSIVDSLFVPELQPALKHPTIFRKFDSLNEGESFVIINDHDPKPLYYQLLAERGNIFSWDYLEQGPEVWKVHVKKNDAANGETVGQIAAKDIRKAEVFKKLGIDFCCGGKKSLKQACEEKGLDVAVVESALTNANEASKVSENYDRWSPDFLADYIFNKHHQYYYDEAPVIGELLTKVVDHHGDRFPELEEVYRLYVTLVQELNSHFAKEEKVLFPFIKTLVQAKQTGNMQQLESQFSLSGPIQMMEVDHDAAGDILAELSEVTNSYIAPEGACNSFQFLYRKLKELDEDLHQHIHLENNILFPKALSLEKELRK